MHSRSQRMMTVDRTSFKNKFLPRDFQQLGPSSVHTCCTTFVSLKTQVFPLAVTDAPVLTNGDPTPDVQPGTLLPTYNSRTLAAFIYPFHTSDATLAPGVEL